MQPPPCLHSQCSRALFPGMSSTPLPDDVLPWEKLVAKAVHDMRSPLSTITTTLAVLRMTIHDPTKAEKLMGIMERQTGDLTEQLNRLLQDPVSFLENREITS